jgi:predicted deacylase
MRVIAGIGSGRPGPGGRARHATRARRRLAALLAVAGLVTSGLATTAAASPAPRGDTRPAATADGNDVFRPYGGPGGLKEEFEQLAADHPDIVELETIGRTVQGQDIVAVKVTRQARRTPDGRRPAILYVGAQHAREWITPEMIRRLAHQVVDGYGTDRALTDLVDSTELWFVPVANPDGYDFTFTPGNRNWRKNLRDNNGDGRIAQGDGVDLNRNAPTRWAYDDEGSSSVLIAENFRGTRPASEPETRALDRLLRRVDFEFLLNYHSAAEQLLYGTSWQVATPTPDDVIYETLAGDDATPAVAGYDPDQWAENAVGNGVLTEHAHAAYGTLAFTPELSSCQTASASDPTDEWEPAACATIFTFPDDEELVAAEFAKNVPFALSAARSAQDPDDPVSVVGRSTPEFVVDAFDTSYGDPQTVAVTARRDQRDRRLNYRINGGRVHRLPVAEWRGGERYGDELDVYYAEYRATIRGARPGDQVEVWFTASRSRRGTVESDHFTYAQASDSGADTLVIANEDYTGVNPTYPAGTTGPKYADDYAAALEANGISSATWDVDAQGVPHPLGVLGHFDAVVWESGDDRLPQEPEDLLTDTFLLGPIPELAVAERQQFLTLAVRDYLNEGGKLVQAGEASQYQGLLGRGLGGIFYGLNGAPDADCAVTGDFLTDCLLLSDDFAQYWLGARERVSFPRPTGVEGAGPRGGTAATFGGQAVVDNPLNDAGAFSLTSDVLPPDRFPQFAAEQWGSYVGAAAGNPLGPVEGVRYASALHQDGSYQRLGRTIDLSGVTAAEAPALSMRLSISATVGFHHVIVEAAPSGTDAWTTLADTRGGTSKGTSAACPVDLLSTHPFLLHYLTLGNPCRTTGTTGEWNAFNGETNGWRAASFNLSAYAGRKVDVKVSYVANVDSASKTGIGVFVDDTRVTTTAGVLDADGFEGATSLWTAEGPPQGSPAADGAGFVIGAERIAVAPSVATEDTVLFGYGIEALATPQERADVLGGAIEHLVGR